jgi:hypothetical protein
MGEPQRFLFVHLQKTGGTALFQRLRDAFGAAAVYPTPEDSGGALAVTDVDHLIERFAAHRAELRVVTGHFPLCMTEVLGVPFTTFTLLRHPVERTLSLLRRRKLVEERFQGLALDEIYEAPVLQDIIRNHMVKMLSLTPAEMTQTPLTAPVTFDAARLDCAKHNLANEVDVFGLQEQFDDFCGELASRFGWDLGPPRFANRTPRGPVPEALRTRIAADNVMDVELYTFAVELAEERRQGASASRG